MVTIRLTRRGGKKTPFYHVVVTDSRKRQGGTSLESVGLFNPVARGAEIKLRLNVARIEHWLKEGAQAWRCGVLEDSPANELSIQQGIAMNDHLRAPELTGAWPW